MVKLIKRQAGKGGTRMLSLETAKKLKDAGMQWEPNYADLYQLIIEGIENIYCYDESILACLEINRYNPTWIPRLDQLLAEIEKRGYNWNIGSGEFWPDKPKYCMGLFGEEGQYIKGQFYGDSPDESAAQALLWILEQEAKA